ncbi:MAG: hypothetical protein HZB16_18525 [Armatimonadetes bacterium]|nr:hypothetical protein [Armatimonadota bacterium]
MRWMGLLFCVCLAACAQELPTALRGEVKEPAALPQGAYRQVAQWEAEQPQNHQTGAEEAEATAAGGKVWAMRLGRDRTESAAIYGPYLDLPAGDYVAFYRLKLPRAVDDDQVARIDAAIDTGREVLTQRPVFASDLSAERWTQVPLAFHVAGRKLEARLTWQGTTDLLLDQITLFELVGGRIPAPARVPQPEYTNKPNNLPYQYQPRAELFPLSSKPASRLSVIDLRSQSADMRHLMLSLEGLVNRTQPRIYVITDTPDELWLKCLLERGGVSDTETIADPTVLIDRYRGLVSGAVVTDAKLPITRNIAMMLASTKDALVASSKLARELKLTVTDDLRGKFKGNVEAQKWAFDTLWPKMCHTVAAVLWPDNCNGLRDYLYQHRIYTFWLSGQIDGAYPGHDAQGEVALIENILSKMPPNMPILGYPWAGKDVGIGEGAGVTLFAQFSKYLVGTIDVTNLSVHSGIKLPDFKQPVYPTPPVDRTKVYVTWVMSDGDNLPVLSRGNFPQLWAQPERGKVPMAWTITPSSHILMPVIADYYYRTSTPNDAWIGSVSGIGYTYPDEYGKRYTAEGHKRAFDDFLAQTAHYGKALDLKQMWIMGIRDPELIRRYAAGVPDLTAIFPDYGKVVRSYDEGFYPSARGIPIFHAATSWAEEDTREQRIARTVEYIRSFTPTQRPAFLHLFIWNWGTDLAQQVEVMKQLGPEYVAVRPEHLATMARAELDRQGALVRLPDRATVLEGENLMLPGTVQNVSRASATAKVTVTGLTDGRVAPGTATLKANESLQFVVRGKVTGETVTVDVSAGAASFKRTVALRVLPKTELSQPVPDRGEAVAEYLGTTLSHKGGAEAKEAGSLAPSVWVAQPARDAAGHICFGPYAPLAAGSYVALFRVKRLGAGDGQLVTLDAHVGGGAAELSSVNLAAKDLPLGEWKLIPLRFDHPGGTIETRVFWSGRAALAVDTILVARRQK